MRCIFNCLVELAVFSESETVALLTYALTFLKRESGSKVLTVRTDLERISSSDRALKPTRIISVTPTRAAEDDVVSVGRDKSMPAFTPPVL